MRARAVLEWVWMLAGLPGKDVQKRVDYMCLEFGQITGKQDKDLIVI